MNIEKLSNGIQILRGNNTYAVRAIFYNGTTACSTEHNNNCDVVEFNKINNGDMLEFTPFDFFQLCFNMCD
jgi:hypothetical protein